jgi:hypothetical protein
VDSIAAPSTRFRRGLVTPPLQKISKFLPAISRNMTLCAICREIDFPALFIASIQHSKARQKAHSDDYNDGPTLSYKHHDDIFMIQRSSQNCQLCKIVFQAFEKRNIADVEEARGLPIVFQLRGSNVEVRYDAEGGIKLCNLDWYMSETDGE